MPIDYSFKNSEIIIPGPPDSPFEGGKFKIKISLPDDYPNTPPNCSFITKVFHPNINFKDGSICVNSLQKVDGQIDIKHSRTNKKTICDIIVGLYICL